MIQRMDLDVALQIVLEARENPDLRRYSRAQQAEAIVGSFVRNLNTWEKIRKEA